MDARGIQATQEKIAAIEKAPMPQQLRSFLELLPEIFAEPHNNNSTLERPATEEQEVLV